MANRKYSQLKCIRCGNEYLMRVPAQGVIAYLGHEFHVVWMCKNCKDPESEKTKNSRLKLREIIKAAS